MKSIQFSFLSGIQIFYPLLMEIDFYLQYGVTRSLLAKFCRNPKFHDFFSEFSSISMHRNFHEFSFKLHFESGEISIRIVVPYHKLFPSIFYLEFFEQGKAPFGSIKVFGKFESV
jgi:hypothetical protein